MCAGGKAPLPAGHNERKAALAALNKVDPFAANLIGCMVKDDPSARPSIKAFLYHPFWWPLGMLNSFATSLNHCVLAGSASLQAALDKWTGWITCGYWGGCIVETLRTSLEAQGNSDQESPKDLLRGMRNSCQHFLHLPPALRLQLGCATPEDMMGYFHITFPRLLLALFYFAVEHLNTDPMMAPFWGSHPAALFATCRTTYEWTG
jgi:serine/threonine-protein kinase/endoribonuclease IRE1